MLGDDPLAFCAVRPPGHHATSSTAMGFCLLNNIAIAAAYARDRHGLERIAVVDFDVHHGNGTGTSSSTTPGSRTTAPTRPGCSPIPACAVTAVPAT